MKFFKLVTVLAILLSSSLLLAYNFSIPVPVNNCAVEDSNTKFIESTYRKTGSSGGNGGSRSTYQVDRGVTLDAIYVNIGKYVDSIRFSTYEVTVVTPKMRNAGTNARVFLKIKGTDHNTTAIHLDNQYNNHQQGDVDVYSYELADVGDIQSIELYHDNTGKKPGWFCESVTIRNARTGKEWYFSVNKWFATSTGDGKLRRTLYSAR